MLRKLVHNYEYVHISIGLLGNVQFFVGSVLFLERFSQYRQVGVWLFVIGSFMMLIGSLGAGLKATWRHFE